MKKTIVQTLDDLDGSDAAESVTFALDGTVYTIDLSAQHAAELRKLLAPYVDAGQLQRRNATGPVPKAYRTSRASREENEKIREWARNTGKTIAGRGRIAKSVVDEYRAQAA